MIVTKAADLLIEKIKKDYKDDIAVVVMMGSHLYHETHSKSDLDMYFIPKTDRGFKLGTVFIIDGIGYDFWPISWDRISKIASHDERIGSIITEGKVIYYSTEEDLDKFNGFKTQALNVSNIGYFTHKAMQKIENAAMSYLELGQSTSLSKTRYHSIKVIYQVTEAISLLNRITIKRGRGKLLNEILSMPIVPNDFEKHYQTIFKSRDIDEIKVSIKSIYEGTRQIITETFRQQEQGSFKDAAEGFYEELINNYNKIERAYDIGDFQTAMFAASEIDMELNSLLGNRGVDLSHLPDLLEVYDHQDLKPLLERSKTHQKALVQLLMDHGVQIRILKDEHELQAYLDQL